MLSKNNKSISIRFTKKRIPLIDKVAEIEETSRSEKCREYVDAGLKKDLKKHNIKE